MDIEPYKSLRSAIFEVQAAAVPVKPADKKPAAKTAHKTGEPWQTASGNWGAKNTDGQTEYFDSEDNAKAWLAGKAGPAGRVDKPGDTSRKVELDADGYEKKPTAAPQGGKAEPKPNAAQPTAQPTARPAAGGAGTPQAQATTSNTQRQAQPQGSEAGAKKEPAAQPEVQHAEVGKENPATEYDAEVKPDEKATADAKAKKDIRKANVVAGAIKNRQFTGPQNTKESVFGRPEEERRFVDEMNHAALSAMRGEVGYEFELCSQTFAQLGFCFDPQTGEKVSKGIKRIEMPQFSSFVNPENKNSTAYKALMAAKGYTSPDQVTPEDLKAEINLEKEYRAALEGAGYTIEEQDVDVTSLKPIQGQLQGSKVVAMYGSLLAAQADPDTYGKAAKRLLDPIYVSDGYVVDGHHRWAAQCAVDIANGLGANATMRTRTISKNGKPVPIDEIIAFSNKFQKDSGLLSQSNTGQTVPEKKPETKTQKEWTMSKFGSTRISRIVNTLNESVSQRVDEAAAKKKIDKTPALGSFKYGVNPDDPSHYLGASKPMKTRKTDAAGNLIKKVDPKKTAARWEKSAQMAQSNVTTAQDLIDTAAIKPEGTTFEIYGKKNGNEYTLKVKKVRKMGEVVYMIAGNREVILNAAGTGLQILDKKTRRIILDRGNDMIWESADLLDVGMICITEAQSKMPQKRKLSDWDLIKVDIKQRETMNKKTDSQAKK